MRTGYPGSHIQLAEQPLLAAGQPLMARASFGLSQHVVRLARDQQGLAGKRVAVLVGPGNNGADSLYAAQILARGPLAVTVYLTQPAARQSGVQKDALVGLAKTQAVIRHVAGLNDAEVSALAREVLDAHIVLDSLLGLGSAGPVRGLIGDLLAELNRQRAGVEPRGRKPVFVAVDLPTGVDATTGEVADMGRVFWADHTVTFGGYKTGTMVGPGALASGQVHLVDIGLPILATGDQVLNLETADLTRYQFIGPRPAGDHKYTAGVLGQVTGSAQYPGAAVLTAGAALASGVGMLRVLGSGRLRAEVRSAHPEIVGQDGRVQAWAVGSGVGPGSEQEEDILAVLRGDKDHGHVVPQVLDAGALKIAARNQLALGEHQILTPHAGEMAQLLSYLLTQKVTRSDVEASPLHFARVAQDHTGATIVLKGPATIIVGKNKTFAQYDGTSRMATAGSGDVLTGLLGSLLAQHYERLQDPALIAAAAVLIHGSAGRVAAGELRVGPGAGVQTTGLSAPITALGLIDALPAVLTAARK